MFQQTIKNFNINFEGVNERNSFSCGDLMTGHVSFELTKETKITSISLALTGKAKVHWTTSSGSGKKRRRRQHTAKLDYFNFKCVLMQENNAVGGTGTFQRGRHVYPFTCQLPHGDFPSSFRGVHGQILYTLTVGIHRPWHMSKDFATELTFINHINPNQPELQAPLSGSNNMTLCCLWCASGPITMTASVEKKAFIPGETVKITCEFRNASSRIATPKVRLQQKQIFYTHNQINKTMMFKNLVSVTGEPVNANTSAVNTGIMLTIPSSAPLTISNCSIIDVNYVIEVSLCVRASSNLTVLFPIILADTLVSAQPPLYFGCSLIMNNHFFKDFEGLPLEWDTPIGEVGGGLYWSLLVSCYVGVPWRKRTMSSTVKSLKITYNPVNEENTFTNGDCVSGEVSLELAKACSVDYLWVKFKGKAEVLWTERHGQTTVVYHSKDKYFSTKHHIIQDKDLKGDDNQALLINKEDTNSSVLAPGIHVYPFTFQIPFQNMPSSFNGSVGKIVYSLDAKLSRSMRIPTKDSTTINFVMKADLTSDPELMTPQHESKDKKMKFFNSGMVAMDVNLEKTGFCQGEGLKVLACIQNNSTRKITPKYCVYRKHVFLARGKRRVSTKDLLKEVGEPISPSSNQNVTRVITIPPDVEPSISNCSIIQAEYRLRVYLDVKYASDPEIKFPIVILRAPQVPALLAPQPAASGFGFEPFGSTNPPAWGIVPPQPPAASGPLDPPPPYGAFGMYPPLSDFGNTYK
ncbi:uncharacterized protein LOC129101820 [Anoplopoma fimbria]|uniref:uncharacterized protein LOC129101820 n=1 Tax=Anoplopoma fimbria TaxID=229290 RepID=UPI0023EAF902|nr:uncharacterized protein LOC129101820 [Anoplopoma fimbria]